MPHRAPLHLILPALLLLCAGTAAAQPPAVPKDLPEVLPIATSVARTSDEDRGVAQASASVVRHVVVKATGQGRTADEAEKDALRAARALAATRYVQLGGADALVADSHGARILALHHSPPMGFAQVRAVALVELRLRPVQEPQQPAPAPALALPNISVRAESGVAIVEGTRPCEVLLVIEHPAGQAPDVLPGGGGAAWRLIPGKPLRQPLPALEPTARLHALACTGGLNAPAAASTVEEVLAKARAGRPRPAVVQGVVSECVEVRLVPGPGGVRSMRQKGSEAPVNMTGAAGRESGLPVPKNP